jgi:uncharacterized protein YbjT (DUF2867 family)
MRILVLGGTSFVGRAIVDDARRTGAEATLFSRGRAGTDLFPGLTRLIGDRDIMFPLARPDRASWPSQQRSPARARAAGLPATPLDVTVADVLAWDRQRGEPPFTGFSPEQEQALLARPGNRARTAG